MLQGVRERGRLLVREETLGQNYRLVLGINTDEQHQFQVIPVQKKNAGTRWKHYGRFRRYHNCGTVNTYMQSSCQSLAHRGRSKGVVVSTNETHLFVRQVLS